MIYFDHNATTPLDPRVLEAMLPYLQSFYGNPSSLYRTGRIARSAIDSAREQVAALVGAEQPSQIIFTSGGTEANNLAIQGMARALPQGLLAASAIEHASVIECLRLLADNGRDIRLLAVDDQGRIDLDALQKLLEQGLRFASIMLANNETGIIQDGAALQRLFADHPAYWHCDVTQAVGKIPVDFKRLGAHLMSVSGHKIYGPKGVGALVIDKTVPLTALIAGGGQEQNLRGGTENVAAIVGFGKAAELAMSELDSRHQHCLKLRLKLEAMLADFPQVTILSRQGQRLPNTLQIAIDGIDGEMLLIALDRQQIAVSSGSACSSDKSQASHVLLAMGIDDSLARNAIRISFGEANSEQEIERFVTIFKNILVELGSSAMLV